MRYQCKVFGLNNQYTLSLTVSREGELWFWRVDDQVFKVLVDAGESSTLEEARSEAESAARGSCKAEIPFLDTIEFAWASTAGA